MECQTESTERFVRLFVQHQRDLFRFILAMVGHAPDAHEVLQETATALWRKIDRYEESQPFLPWARQFAYYEVLKHRQRKRGHMPQLPEDVLEVLAQRHQERTEDLADRRRALAGCLEKLPEKDRQLVEQRYWGNDTLQQVAERTGQSVHMLYKSLVQIRRRLFDCITRSLAVEEG